MNIAILSAGESSRIRSEGVQLPKALLKLGNELLFDRLIRIVKQNGFQSVICIINKKEKLLREHIQKRDYGIKLNLLIKSTESSMHSLFELSPYLQEDNFFLLTVDTIFQEGEFKKFIQYCTRNNDAHGILAVTDFIDDEKPLCVKMNEKNIILEFSDVLVGYNFATGGVYYLSPEIFDVMEEAKRKGIKRLRNFFRLLLHKDYKLSGYRFSKIVDVDHLKDLETAREFIMNAGSSHKVSHIVNL